MIAFIDGILISNDDDKAVVDVNGVGYEITVTDAKKLPAIGSRVKYYTYFHKTDSQDYLYGFTSMQEKSFFKTLIGISDIGPRVASNILSNIDLNTLKTSIVNKDIRTLLSVPRVKKLAERIILELKDKLLKEDLAPGSKVIIDVKTESDVTDALVSLGYNSTTARNALEAVLTRLKDEKPDLNRIVKECLKELGK